LTTASRRERVTSDQLNRAGPITAPPCRADEADEPEKDTAICLTGSCIPLLLTRDYALKVLGKG